MVIEEIEIEILNCLIEMLQNDFTMVDVTADVKAIITGVAAIIRARSCNLTLLYLADIYKGANLQKIREANLTSSPIYGRGRSWNKVDIERLLHKLVIEEYLKEDMYIKNEIACGYIKLGQNAEAFMRSKDTKVSPEPTKFYPILKS